VLQALGVSIFPSGSRTHQDWVSLGIALAKGLTEHGFNCVEVYPFASRKGLKIGVSGLQAARKRSRSSRSMILADLVRQVDLGRFAAEMLRDHDQIDAVICALTAHLWATHKALMLDLGGRPPFVVPRKALSN